MKKEELDRLGGASEVARICGVSPQTVYMWFAPKDKKGCGGHIPYKHAKKIADKCYIQNWTIEYIMGEEE